MAPIRTLLIANRGEIACRIARTARRLGLRTVAVFSDADAGMPHVAACDEAVRIGAAPSRESYLVTERILEAARRTGADAIHPGYGFLSENGDFAAACEAAGTVFVGPTPAAIRSMGSKKAAKQLVSAHGVPVVPGYDGDDQSVDTLEARAREIGFPVLLKASAGGGGKGMRIVRGPSHLVDAIEGAKREAANAFGDDTLLIERYIDNPRHIEIQILGDQHGNLVHLFERECSIQRRHQKIIEESPSVALTAAQREAMGASGVTVGHTIGYTNAGTVEFIVAPNGDFYFLEVNTRLQVEHPVTELVTGLDLVELQIRVAEGERLPFAQSDLRQTGAAVECRLYAEDPAKGFLPHSGTLVEWSPPCLEGLRIDGGIAAGSEIPMHYDPMIAKIITGGRDRDEARRRMIRALEQLVVAGIPNNRAFLLRVLEHEAYVRGDIHTHFIEQHFGTDLAEPPAAADLVRAAVAATLVEIAERGAATPLPSVPWGFRTLRSQDAWTEFVAGEHRLHVKYRPAAGGLVGWSCDGHGGDWLLVSRDGALATFEDAAGHRFVVRVVRSGDRVFVHLGRTDVTLVDVPRYPDPSSRQVEGGCVAPMPGKVSRLRVAVGDVVAAGAPLVVLEAMKMEHTLTAAEAGVVAEVLVREGEQVDAGQVLAVVHAAEAS
jgi:3-methylcrotonyl-CoA carboxylase alpha subunit